MTLGSVCRIFATWHLPVPWIFPSDFCLVAHPRPLVLPVGFSPRGTSLSFGSARRIFAMWHLPHTLDPPVGFPPRGISPSLGSARPISSTWHLFVPWICLRIFTTWHLHVPWICLSDFCHVAPCHPLDLPVGFPPRGTSLSLGSAHRIFATWHLPVPWIYPLDFRHVVPLVPWICPSYFRHVAPPRPLDFPIRLPPHDTSPFVGFAHRIATT